jgi:hypothetical protein
MFDNKLKQQNECIHLIPENLILDIDDLETSQVIAEVLEQAGALE